MAKGVRQKRSSTQTLDEDDPVGDVRKKTKTAVGTDGKTLGTASFRDNHF